MRMLLTADWHLGRLLHAINLLEDQSHVLEQVLATAREARLDAVVIAGDVYDRPAPSADAVRLLDYVLSRLVKEIGVRVFLIAGNHDSPDRIGYGGRIFEDQRLHVVGSLADGLAPVRVDDEHGAVTVHAIPYAGPLAARLVLDTEELQNHEDVMKAAIARSRRKAGGSGRSILIAHAFVAGGSESESERPLTVGGTAAVKRSVFKDFTFVALGHLHQSQTPGDRIHYPGSLLKYSISETDHAKGFKIVDIDGAGGVKVEAVPLAPIRDLRRIEGRLDDLLNAGRADRRSDDYIVARLTDECPLLNPMLRLQRVYPNALHIEQPEASAGGGEQVCGDRTIVEPAALFPEFYRHVTGREIGCEQKQIVDHVFRSLRDEDASR